MGCIASIVDSGADKSFSLADLRAALGKITACKVDGQWLVSPGKKSGTKRITQRDVEVTSQEVAAEKEGMPPVGQHAKTLRKDCPRTSKSATVEGSW